MAEIRKRRGRRSNGEGTITRRKDGLWQAAIYVPHPDGTVRRRYLYNRDRDRLREELNELTYQVGKGIPVLDGSVTVGEYLDQWLAEVAAKQVRATTYTGYETNVRLHIKPLIGSKKLAKLTARDVRQMVEALRIKPLSRGTGIISDRAVQYVHATLRAALEQACREELIPRNVAKLVQASVQDAKQHEPYSPKESKQLLAHAEKHRLHALWVLLVMLGIRRGEALALRWTDVDLDRRWHCRCLGQPAADREPIATGTDQNPRLAADNPAARTLRRSTAIASSTAGLRSPGSWRAMGGHGPMPLS